MAIQKSKKIYAVVGASVLVMAVGAVVFAKKNAPVSAVAATNTTAAAVEAVATVPPATIPRYLINKDFDVVPIDPAGDKKIVLLTIDDGPASATTIDPILKALADANVHAIFFSIGKLVKAHPELLKKELDAGNMIGNHTWDHPDLKKMTDAQIKKEIDDTTTAIKRAISGNPLFFRPPYGMYNQYLKTYIGENKMVFMNWSLGAEDWVKKYQTKDALVSHVLGQLHPGANILMHEHPWTAEALPEIIKGIKDAGYTIVDPKEIRTLQSR